MISDKPSPGSQPWPADELEDVETCPYCDARQRSLAFHNVEDWTFGCAPGKWDYWRCDSCGALYLNPRPTAASIGKAYTRYYTHADSAGTSLKERIKTALRHTCYAAWYGIPLRPCLPWPRFMQPLLAPLRHRVAEPSFILQALNRLPRGRLMDVGCGNGINLTAARQLGWTAQGLEIDPQAVATARATGLDVLQGDYKRLDELPGAFDCIICSHVIEHVHEPVDLLQALYRTLKPGGTVLFSLPNADSVVLSIVGENWRGLEAPRHLAIPTRRHMAELATRIGFVIEDAPVSHWTTLQGSLVIARRRGLFELSQRVMTAAQINSAVDSECSDFINLVLKKT